MSYRVEIERVAAKAVARLPKRDGVRVLKAIDSLALDPRPAGVEKMTEIAAYRIRVGDYCVVYTIDDAVRVVKVSRVGNRRDIYRRLR